MKKLHHPATPCKINNYRDLDISILKEGYKEIVNCSDGWAIFGKDSFWVSNEEFSKINLSDNFKIFKIEGFDLNGWGFYSPISLEIELTKNCNQRCIHCWNKSGNGSAISLGKLEEIVDEFREKGGQDLKLTGGEPLSHPSFFNFVEYSKEKGVRNIGITTNGSLINEDNVRFLSEYIDQMNISLHGATEESHNKITRSNNYQKVIRAISLCNDYGLSPVINFTIMGKNKPEIEAMFKLFQNSKNRIRFNLLMQRGSGKKLEDISSEVFQLRKEINYFGSVYSVELERSELYPQGYNDGIEFSKFYGCSALRTGMYISSEELVFPCNLANNPIGNIHDSSISDIWRSGDAKKIREITLCEGSSCGVSCGGKCKVKEI